MFPPPHMGWQRRRKSEHYECLQKYVEEISEILEIDSWHLLTDWFVSEDKCLEKETCRQMLASEVDEFLARITVKYETLGIDREPVAFIKNDRGTYGLGIMAVRSGEELLNLSNRKFKKLMYSKGGVDVENFLIQEGVPTIKTPEDAPVEPVVYLVDGEAASWFYRINSKIRYGKSKFPISEFPILQRRLVRNMANTHMDGMHLLQNFLCLRWVRSPRDNWRIVSAYSLSWRWPSWFVCYRPAGGIRL